MNCASLNSPSHPLVSIVMNCYNGSKYLKEAVESVLNQTYKNWELVFWDNQSSDESAAIINAYVDKRIRYFSAPEHTPLGKARNLAVKQAKGEWLSFLDCDDLLHKEKISSELNAVDNETGIVYCRTEFLIEEAGASSHMGKAASKKKYYPSMATLPTGEIKNQLLFDCFISLPSAIVKKSLFWESGGVDETLFVAEDYDIFLKIANVSKVKAVDRPLCVYRVHARNLSHSNIDRTFTESIHVVRKYGADIWVRFALVKWKIQYAKSLFLEGRFKKIFTIFSI